MIEALKGLLLYVLGIAGMTGGIALGHWLTGAINSTHAVQNGGLLFLAITFIGVAIISIFAFR